jgi:hypothetical protein
MSGPVPRSGIATFIDLELVEINVALPGPDRGLRSIKSVGRMIAQRTAEPHGYGPFLSDPEWSRELLARLGLTVILATLCGTGSKSSNPVVGARLWRLTAVPYVDKSR